MAPSSSHRSASSTPPGTTTPATPATLYDEKWLDLVYNEVHWTLRTDHKDKDRLQAQFAEFKTWRSNLADETPVPITDSVTLATTFLTFLLEQASALDVIVSVLSAIQTSFIRNGDAHSLALTLDPQGQRLFLKSYYRALEVTGMYDVKPSSALLCPDGTRKHKIYAICGGQGPSNGASLQELQELNTVYAPLLRDLIRTASQILRKLSATTPFFRRNSTGGFDLARWLEQPESAPVKPIIASAPYSFPLIGLIALANYCITCKVLGQTPEQVRSRMQGVTGHSQGIVCAAVIAASTTWDSFYHYTKFAMEALFWIGIEAHQGMKFGKVPLSAIQDCVESNEGAPSPMLSIQGLDQRSVEGLIRHANKDLASDAKLYLALINSRENMVVAGPPRSLHGLNTRLRNSNRENTSQGQVPFNKRKARTSHTFLPISAAFHSPYADPVVPHIQRALKAYRICGNDLGISLFHTSSGIDLKSLGKADLVEPLIRMITSEPVDWLSATQFPGASYVLDFGPGRIGGLMRKITDGMGVRIISVADMRPPTAGVGDRSELFSASLPETPPNWGEIYAPKVTTNSMGKKTVETRMTKLLGVPPVMVAGMTPTTVPWDVVASVMQAGYHAELAGGGYITTHSLETAIKKVAASIPSNSGITCNIIYASPKTVSWQIPLIKRMVQEGYPVDGLTIGAGVPSTEVANEYVETLGLKHISFKPGSQEAILQVIDIAKDHPTFPIGLQWTGGRGGGHHSSEDFHAPLLATYSKIRSCGNIILIAGSGFGGAQDTLKYLTGEWSRDMGYPLMPFDGILLGSRIMATKEAHTSSQAKDLIVQAPGVEDSEWHHSYDKVTGGVVTVTSEMGQPIHKLATRGVLLWKEFDRRFFSIVDRSKRVTELQKHKQEIIDRLNADFQKPWFCVDSHGTSVDIEDMTYHEVIQRLISLMYVHHQSRWIDRTYRTLVADFVFRAEERLVKSGHELDRDLSAPKEFLSRFLACYPSAAVELLHPEDASYFIGLCLRKGQKPVNFIPRLDENFETWFKKDSLWQAEDVDAVIDQDVQRVCIIHGPVAARYSCKKDEPVKSVLDDIMSSYINMMPESTQSKDSVSEIQGVTITNSPVSISSPTSSDRSPQTCTFQMSEQHPSLAEYLENMELSGGIRACIYDQNVLINGQTYSNPIKAALELCHNHILSISFDDDYRATGLSISKSDGFDDQPQEILKVSHRDDTRIDVKLIERNRGDEATNLEFVFEYQEHKPFTRLVDVTEDRDSRVKRFYSHLWLGTYSESLSSARVSSEFEGDKICISHRAVQDFMMATDQAGSIQAYQTTPDETVPIGFCIVLAWSALVKPLLIDAIGGDLLRLLHRSNEFQYIKGARPLCIGDVVESSSRVQAVTVTNSGKLIEVRAEIRRGESTAVIVTSTFFIQGTFKDYEDTFRHTSEPLRELVIKGAKEFALLKSRHWAQLSGSQTDFVGRTLIFDTITRVEYASASQFRSLYVSGEIYVRRESKLVKVGNVRYETGYCSENPVNAFLNRHGTLAEATQSLPNPGWDAENSLTVRVPPDNAAYAQVSHDVNPIHVSQTFVGFAQLSGIVTHGMLTSAVVERLLESAVAEADITRLRRWRTLFEGKVLPDDELRIELQHVGMIAGRMLFAVQVFKGDDSKVLEAEAEIEQPRTAYVFTGQGSQEKNMGMALYETSAAAKMVWDRADRHLIDLYGFSIIDIVRNDPTQLHLHFGGLRGRKIRQNYMDMTIDKTLPDSTVVTEPIVKDLKADSLSYTFSDERGLLYSTQFAQPALTIMELAAFEDAKSKGLVQEGAVFAGHSLGEYSALGAIGEVLSIESLVTLVFYRGLTMQVAMERDENGRTEFSMVAASPSRVSKKFDQAAFEKVVGTIARESQVLLEIVNYNVQGRQYVCAGHLRALWMMGQVLDSLAGSEESVFTNTEALTALVRQYNASAQELPTPISLERGVATIPLRGIDVPFHSSFIRGGIDPYRKYLHKTIRETDVDSERLVDRFIPNVMAKPFSLSRAYVEEAAKVMDSAVLRQLLAKGCTWSD